MLNYNYYDIPQNEWNKKTIEDAINYSNNVCGKLYKFIAEYLSLFHQKDFYVKEVEILLGDWINLYVQVIIDRYQSIKKLDKIPPWLNDCDNLIAPPFCSNEFGSNTALSNNYNKQIYKLIYMYEKNNNLKEKFSKNFFDLNYEKKVSKKRKLIYYLYKTISNNNSVLIDDLYIKNFFDRLKLAWRNRDLIRVYNITNDFRIKYRISMEKRFSNLEKLNSDTEIEIFIELLPFFIPSAYLECFENLEQSVVSIDFDYLFTSTFFGSASPQFRILVNQNKNCKILNRFHGGGYIIFSNYWAESYESTNSDYCFSSGSLKPNSVKKEYRYLPPPIIKKKSRKSGTYFFIGPNPKFVTSINGYSIGKKNIELCNSTAKLLNKIVSPNLKIRLYNSSWAKKHNDILSTIVLNGGGQICNNKDSIKIMQSAEIIIHNYLGTSFMESLGLNKPTICFYDEDVYSFSKEFKKYITDFKKFGIFHTNIDQAASHYFNVYKNCDEWWYQNELQLVIKDFQNKFFYINNNWMNIWEKTLQNIISYEN